MSAPGWLIARPIAHRGLHDRANGVVENSFSAVAAAIAGGFAVECDVQATMDGDAVVFHDHTLDRLTDQTGSVRDRTAAELTRVSLLGTQDRISRLQDFLDHVDARVPVIVEIKSRFDGDPALTRRTVEIATRYRGPVALKSFDPTVVATLRELAPDLPRGIVGEASYEDRDYEALSAETKRDMAHLLHFPLTEPHFVSWRVRDLPSAPPFLCRHLGHLPIMAWTVRTDEERRRALAHADQMVFEGFRPDV